VTPDRVESAYYDYMGYDPSNVTYGLGHYVPWFPEGPVLELAPGRGEFLALLREQGVKAYGVDLDEGMVEVATAAGLDVRLGDALEALRAVPDGTLGGVFSAHFVEHLPAEVVQAVVVEAGRALRPGGVFVAATPNAGCQSVIGYDFWKDPTHVRFYDEHLLAFFCTVAGLKVLEHGGNPRNHAGPPPAAHAPAVTVDPTLTEELRAAVLSAATPKRGTADPSDPWFTLGHLLSVQAERLQQTQAELRDLRAAYTALLDRLFPSNEVYVVARRA
jgi:SAM-dependent methyltransferase